MQISQERKKLLEENIKGRKWQWVAENIKDQIEYIREQESLNVFAAELARSEISIDFFDDFVRYMANLEQEIAQVVERKDVEYEELMKSLSQIKVMT